MARLPQPGQDDGTWGDLLNDFLQVEHNADGTLKASGSLLNKYTKPPTGIPETDLATAVQTKIANLSGTNTGDQDLSGLVLKTTTVNGKALTSSIALTKGDVGLGNVDNTSDANKPVSTAQATAIATNSRAVARAAGFVVIGDSITSYGINTADVWHKTLGVLSNGRMQYRGYFATAGYTLAQIESTHVPSVLAMSRRPGACIVAGGTNDVGGVSYDAAASRATLIRIINTLQLAGIMPVLWTLPPRDDSTTVNAHVQRWNVWLRYTAQSLGLPFVDAHAALTDPATGKYLTAYKLDDVHPNTDGHFRIGKRTALDSDFLRRFPSGIPHLSDSKLDVANLIPSGNYLFDSGVNGAGVPTGWGAYNQPSAYTISIVSDAAIIGKWARLSKTANQALGGGLQYNITSGFAAGDTIAYAVRVKMSADDSGVKALYGVSVASRSSGISIATSSTGGGGGSFDGIVYGEFIVPATTDTLRIDMSIAATPVVDSYVQFAQPTIVNLTALGIA